MKWVTLDEWYGWCTYEHADKAPGELEARRRDKDYKEIPDELWNELREVEASITAIQGKIRKLP